MKTTELTGAALDWAVAKCEGAYLAGFAVDWRNNRANKYSSNWAKGGPIIEREQIDIKMTGIHTWRAETQPDHKDQSETGATPLEAAMRCYVASKLGDTVDIPKELHP